jgi:Ca-activated chloride channel homolog
MSAPDFGWRCQHAAWLWCLPLVLGVWLWWRARRPRVLVAPPWGAAALPQPGRWALALGPLVELGGALLLVLALAGPERVVPAPPAPPGRDVLLCLDTSSSMAERDLGSDRTRFELATAAAAAFARGRQHDRVGLVAFARYADLRCPPTPDRDATAELLTAATLVEREGPEDATAIGAAVATAGEALARLPAAAGKVVVLVTDGEENVATIGAPQEIAPAVAAAFCKAAGIRVHAIVVGAHGDGPGTIDTTAVAQLAQATGGRWFRAGDADSLRGIWAAIDALETAAMTPPGQAIERWFVLPTAVAMLCFLGARARRAARGGLA